MKQLIILLFLFPSIAYPDYEFDNPLILPGSPAYNQQQQAINIEREQLDVQEKQYREQRDANEMNQINRINDEIRRDSEDFKRALDER